MRGFRGEEGVDGRLSLGFSHRSGHRDSFVVSLGALHRTRPASESEEVEYGVEWLFQFIQHFSERPALTVLKKIVTGCVQFGHGLLQFD
jgi:hypothetical protein